MSPTKDINLEDLKEEFKDSPLSEFWLEESKDGLSPEEIKYFSQVLRDILNQDKSTTNDISFSQHHAIINHNASSVSNDEYIKEFKDTWFPSGALLENLLTKDLEIINNQEFGNMYPSLDWWIKNRTRKLIFLNLVISRAQLEGVMATGKDMPGFNSLFIFFKDDSFHKIGGLTSVEDFQEYDFVSRQSITDEIRKGIEEGYIKKWEGIIDNRKKAYSLSEDSWKEFRRWIHDLINLDENGEIDHYVDIILDRIQGISEEDEKFLKDVLLGLRLSSRLNLFFSVS